MANDPLNICTVAGGVDRSGRKKLIDQNWNAKWESWSTEEDQFHINGCSLLLALVNATSLTPISHIDYERSSPLPITEHEPVMTQQAKNSLPQKVPRDNPHTPSQL